jgi:putative sigma-54 modulation protein
MDVLSGQDLDQGTEEPRVIRTKTLAIIPQSLDEAVVQMDLLNQDFLVFRNSGNDRINVLYRRQDGDYLLVEPEAE